MLREGDWGPPVQQLLQQSEHHSVHTLPGTEQPETKRSPAGAWWAGGAEPGLLLRLTLQQEGSAWSGWE